MELGLDYKLESPILSYLLPPDQLNLLKVPKPPKIAPATWGTSFPKKANLCEVSQIQTLTPICSARHSLLLRFFLLPTP